MKRFSCKPSDNVLSDGSVRCTMCPCVSPCLIGVAWRRFAESHDMTCAAALPCMFTAARGTCHCTKRGEDTWKQARQEGIGWIYARTCFDYDRGMYLIFLISFILCASFIFYFCNESCLCGRVALGGSDCARKFTFYVILQWIPSGNVMAQLPLITLKIQSEDGYSILPIRSSQLMASTL